MDHDFCIFNTRMGGRYLYDTNTNTVHPVPDEIDDQFIRKIYDTSGNDIIHAVEVPNDELGAFLRYVTLWRKHTDAFSRKPCPPRFQLSGVDEAHKSQLLTSLAWDLILITTEECNLRCAYCIHEEDLYPNRDKHGSRKMDIETTRKAIDLYLAANKNEMVKPFNLRALNIVFYGGEALLNWDVVKDGITYSREKYDGQNEFHIGITTNLTLLSCDDLPFLRDNKVFLTVSLDGPGEEHDRYRVYKNGAPTSGDVMKNLAMIRDFDREYYDVYVKALVTINGNSDMSLIADFFENTRDKIKIQIVSPLKDMFDSLFHKRYPFNKEKFIESANRLQQSFENECLKGRNFSTGEPFYAFCYDVISGSFGAPNFCNYEKQWYTGICAPWRKMAITPDGNIHMCERIGTGKPVGHIDYGFDEERLLQFYNEFFLSTDDCGSCWARNRCIICPAEVDSGGKPYFENRCDNIRDKVMINLENLYSMLELKPDLFVNEFPYY